MTQQDIPPLSDHELEHLLALAVGYTYAGDFHGRDLYHPQGLRTQVVTLPAYTTDWQALMPLILRYHMLDALVALDHDGYPMVQRALCEALFVQLCAEHPHEEA